MAEPLKITVKGTDESGVDAPTVDDLVTQIQDFVAVLKGVEAAISENGKEEIVWRVTNVTKNSPLAFELTPFPRQHAMNIDNRVQQVVQNTANGFATLATIGERPAYFSDSVIAKAEKVYQRVTNGLAETTIDFSRYKDTPIINVSRETALKSVKNISTLKTPPAIPYKELGSVEGFITKVEKDGHGRPIVWIKTRIDENVVKCVADGDALSRIGHKEVEEVWSGLRVRVSGILFYKSLGKLEKIDADAVQFFDDDSQLPSMEAIIDPEFTRGLESVEFLRLLRENDQC